VPNGTTMRSSHWRRGRRARYDAGDLDQHDHEGPRAIATQATRDDLGTPVHTSIRAYFS
jgi:hypothetical protein